MLASKSKSGLSDASNNRTTPSTPRVSKVGRVGAAKPDPLSPSPLQSSRISVDRSPKSAESKPTLDRRSPKIGTPPDKQPRGSKGSELQDELKKARELLASAEREKARALEELGDAKRLADEANEKFKDALIAQKWAEESSDIEKSRADELEQSGNESARKREEEWKKELDDVRNQHAMDLSVLLSTTQDLHKVRHELAMTCEAKNTALSHADDAMKIAEINAEKVEFLSREVSRLKTLLDSKSKSVELVKGLDTEADALRNEVERARIAEDKLAEMKALVEGLHIEIADAKREGIDGNKLLDEWKRKAELLEVRVDEADRTKKEAVDEVKKLDLEVDTLKRELERAKVAEEKLVEMEAFSEGLTRDVTDAKAAEMTAGKLVDEWERKAELLQVQLEEANRSGMETEELVKKLGTEVDSLKFWLEGAKATEEKLIEIESLLEGLQTEVTNAKMAEMDAGKLIDEWKKKAELLQERVEEVNQSKLKTAEIMEILNSEVDALKHELERANEAKEKLLKIEGLFERMKTEVTEAKKAEAEAINLIDESRRKAEMLEREVEEANKSAKSSSDSLVLVEKQLEESKASLCGTKSEIIALRDIIESLEVQIATHKEELKESNQTLEAVKKETSELGSMIMVLKSEIQISEEEKLRMVSNEKAMASKFEAMSEARNKLINEPEVTRDEAEKAKKAMEDLALTVHKLQGEREDANTKIHELNMALNNTQASYEPMLDEARDKIGHLNDSIKRYEIEAETLSADRDAKELNFISSIKRSEEEIAALKDEMEKVADSLKQAEHEAQVGKDATASAIEIAEATKAESLRYKEMLLDKENELQNITQENEELQTRESAALRKIEELVAFLAEVTSKRTTENGHLRSIEKESDPLHENPNESAVEEDNRELNPKGKDAFMEKEAKEDTIPKEENGDSYSNGRKESMEMEAKAGAKCETADKGLASEREHEMGSTDDELDSNRVGIDFDQINGLPLENLDNGATSPTKSQQQKKKKPLFQKFGRLLKKKSNHV